MTAPYKPKKDICEDFEDFPVSSTDGIHRLICRKNSLIVKGADIRKSSDGLDRLFGSRETALPLYLLDAVPAKSVVYDAVVIVQTCFLNGIPDNAKLGFAYKAFKDTLVHPDPVRDEKVTYFKPFFVI